MSHRIIVIDDETDFLDTVKRGLIIAGFEDTTLESDPVKAAGYFAAGESFDIALIDITMPGTDGITLLKNIRENSPGTECIMVTALNEAHYAVDCMKKGAYDYLVKPFDRNDLILTINRALERKRLIRMLEIQKENAALELKNPGAFSEIITQSPDIMKVLREAELHAVSTVPVLITGDSGTGKELLARSIHRASPRRRKKFSAINMASISHALFDSEFFGHTRGAFTGAEKNRKGYLETTDKGTLFLDEIGYLPPVLQGKLLRVLQEGEYLKLGTDTPQKTDVRIIAATNADLDCLVAAGKFRKDLYYRLKGAWLHLPPLKKRPEDIIPLIRHFLSSAREEKPSVNDAALSALTRYDYPGNIRELKSIIDAGINLSQGQTITPDHLPPHLHTRPNNKTRKMTSVREINGVEPLAAVEKRYILDVYRRTNKNKSRTARLLGIGLNTLRRRLDTYGIS